MRVTAVTFPGAAELEPIVGEEEHATLDCSCELVDVDDRVGIDQDQRPWLRRRHLRQRTENAVGGTPPEDALAGVRRSFDPWLWIITTADRWPPGVGLH